MKIIRFYLIVKIFLFFLINNEYAVSTEILKVEILNNPSPGYINITNTDGSVNSFSLFDNYSTWRYNTNPPNYGMQQLIDD